LNQLKLENQKDSAELTSETSVAVVEAAIVSLQPTISNRINQEEKTRWSFW